MIQPHEVLPQSEGATEISSDLPQQDRNITLQAASQEIKAQALDALDTFKGLESVAPQDVMIQPEVHSLMAEARSQIGRLEQSAQVRLAFLEATRCLVYFPENSDVETVLLPVPRTAKTGDAQWREAACESVKRGETVVIDDTIPEEVADQAEQQVQEFNPEKQFGDLRVELQKIICDSAAVKKFVNSYTPQVLRRCLSSFSQGEPFGRQFSGVISQFSSSIRKEGSVTEGVKEDINLAKTEFTSLSQTVKGILQQEFNFKKCFGTTDQETALQRNSQINLVKIKLGRFDALSGLLFHLTDASLRREAMASEKKVQDQALLKMKEVELVVPPEPIKSVIPAEKRLRSEFEINQRQEWLDQERENAFLKVRESLRALEKTGTNAVREWFATFFSGAAAENGEAIMVSELQSLVLAEVKSESASQVAGCDIVRPIFLIQDEQEFVRFAKKLGLSGDTSGMNIQGIYFPPTSMFYKTGLIISPGEKVTIDHEIRHSIDPNGMKRQGLDGAINEAFAYYSDLIAKNWEKKNTDGTWWVFEATLAAPSYVNHYFNEVPTAERPADWKEQINKMVTAIRMFTQKKGMVETQRLLAKTKTIKELIAASERV